MRQVFTSIVFFFLLSSLFGQNYTPVIINGEVFFKTELLTDEGVLSAEVTVANLITIDDVFYVRTFLKRGFEADMLIGYLREDPGTSELYFRTTGSSNDQLIYTMNLALGDQINLPARWCDNAAGNIATVVAINTIDGKKEIVFDRTVGEGEICETLRFLEGVGPSASVIYAYLKDQPIQNGVAQRICHASRNAEVFYPSDTSFDLCGGMIVNTEEEALNAIKFWPNPANSRVQLSNINADDLIIVRNNKGQIVLKAAGMDKFSVQNWTPGLYHLQLFREERFVLNERLIVIP